MSGDLPLDAVYDERGKVPSAYIRMFCRALTGGFTHQFVDECRPTRAFDLTLGKNAMLRVKGETHLSELACDYDDVFLRFRG